MLTPRPFWIAGLLFLVVAALSGCSTPDPESELCTEESVFEFEEELWCIIIEEGFLESDCPDTFPFGAPFDDVFVCGAEDPPIELYEPLSELEFLGDCTPGDERAGDCGLCECLDLNWSCGPDPACELREDCGSGTDDDFDGLADCADPDCAEVCADEVCDNSVDDDLDGLADCVDPECDEFCGPESCYNGIDDDSDGAVDCDDSECATSVYCAEYCRGGEDEDGDGDIDCDDSDCLDSPDCIAERCFDGIDNDGDEDIDCDDLDCIATVACSACALIGESDRDLDEVCVGDDVCTNGDDTVDLDADGVPDFCDDEPGDEVCDLWMDADGDGLWGCEDPECWADPACSRPEDCHDDVDNDQNGFEDCDDVACAAYCREICTASSDTDGDGDIGCADSDCNTTTSRVCRAEICNNGIDDDADGLVDCESPRCCGAFECRDEENCEGFELCANEVDDDGDGDIDCDDLSCVGTTACGP